MATKMKNKHQLSNGRINWDHWSAHITSTVEVSQDGQLTNHKATHLGQYIVWIAH